MDRMWLAVVLLTGCSDKIWYDTPLPVDDTFPRVEATGAALERYRSAAAYSVEHAGLALLVLEGTDVVFEQYDHGHAGQTPHHLYSGTKSFTCALAQALVADGLLDLDERVVDTLPEFSDGDRKDRVTVRQLLSFTSGIDQPWFKLSADGMRVDQKVEDKYAFAVGVSAKHEPGEVWQYGSAHQPVFGELATRKLGGDPLAYLEQRVFDPIGMRFSGWIRDPSGNPALPYGAFTTADEWAKFGVLARDDGAWQGEQVLPPGAFSECWQGSDANPGYGLTWWLNRSVPADTPLQGFGSLEDYAQGEPLILAGGPSDLVVAAGYDDQRLYVIPSEDLVVVRLGTGDRKWSDGEFIGRVLGLR
jgi:CubicO group peptidase (beta-lactamase class C family)